MGKRDEGGECFRQKECTCDCPRDRESMAQQNKNNSTCLQGRKLRGMRQVGKGHFLNMKLYPNSKEELLKVFEKTLFGSDFTHHKIHNVE